MLINISFLSEIYKKKQLFSPLMTDAYSLSQYTVYPLFDNNSAKSSHDVFTHDPAGQEKPILICITYFWIKYFSCLSYSNILLKKKRKAMRIPHSLIFLNYYFSLRYFFMTLWVSVSTGFTQDLSSVSYK